MKHPLGDSRDYALHEIMSWIMRRTGESHRAFEPTGELPIAGDIVILANCATTPWWVSAVVSTTGERYGKVTLRAIGRDDIAEWEDVSYTILNRKWVSDNPRLFWTDAERAFTRRLHKMMGEMPGVRFNYAGQPNILLPDGDVLFYQDSYFDGPRYTAELLDWKNMDDHRMATILRHVIAKFEEHARALA
jgi:hypothetical protein